MLYTLYKNDKYFFTNKRHRFFQADILSGIDEMSKTLLR